MGITKVSTVNVITLSAAYTCTFTHVHFPNGTALLGKVLVFRVFPTMLSLITLCTLFSHLNRCVPFVNLGARNNMVFTCLNKVTLRI